MIEFVRSEWATWSTDLVVEYQAQSTDFDSLPKKADKPRQATGSFARLTDTGKIAVYSAASDTWFLTEAGVTGAEGDDSRITALEAVIKDKNLLEVD